MWRIIGTHFSSHLPLSDSAMAVHSVGSSRSGTPPKYNHNDDLVHVARVEHVKIIAYKKCHIHVHIVNLLGMKIIK